MTKTEKKLMVSALRNAEEYQTGLAAAWRNKGPEAVEAFKKVKAYLKLRQKLSEELGIDMKNALEKAIDDAELVDINYLKKNGVRNGN